MNFHTDHILPLAALHQQKQSPCFTALLIPVFLLLQGGILAAVSGTSDGSSLTAVSYKLVLVTREV